MRRFFLMRPGPRGTGGMLTEAGESAGIELPIVGFDVGVQVLRSEFAAAIIIADKKDAVSGPMTSIGLRQYAPRTTVRDITHCQLCHWTSSVGTNYTLSPVPYST